MKLTLQWKWFLGLAALLAVLLLVVNLATDLVLPPYLVGKIRADLERDAHLAREIFARAPTSQINPLTHELAGKTSLRVTVIAPDGTVIGESDKTVDQLAQIENHLYRTEVQDALRHGVGSATRHSNTVGADMMYVSVKLDNVGIIRVAMPLREIAAITARVRWTVGLASVAVALLFLPVIFRVARRLTGPIEDMRAMAARVAGGDFSRRAPETGGPELHELGAALNRMSSQLEARLRELTEEKAELNAVLSSMNEGVLVVDAAGTIRIANAALRRQFQLADQAIGKTVLEVFRNVELEDLISHPGARTLTFLLPVERVYAVAAAVLTGAAGTVVVFHDITRLQQLENIRKEFVANVSHELRTPLSIIKGYVETLLEDPPPDAATARQFCEKIRKHSRRLENLIEDILSISALESQQTHLEFGPVAMGDVAHSVADELARQAGEKNIVIALDLPSDLPDVRGDRQQLHQVFVNLLDNGIKYTQPGGRVSITAQPRGAEMEMCVADNGPGIEPEHLPRIFERFYRADKNRSREMGGTGLGLSIVKHIIQAHGGRVWAESTTRPQPDGTGTGSRFYFTLPRA